MRSLGKLGDLIVGAFTITAVVVFALTIFYNLDNDNTSTTGVVETLPVGLPKEISIPAISVRANVQHVGITKDGDMAVPSNYTDVGWYKDGTIPGEIGTAVIDGHLDGKRGLPAVFARLAELKVGDVVEVITYREVTIRFKVTDIKVYQYDDPEASKEVFVDSTVSTLKLITCDGPWLTKESKYAKRLVVTAERE